MLTYAGKMLANNVLVGVEPIIGTHIALGLNLIYDSNPNTGINTSSSLDRFHSPYIVDEMTAVNPGVLTQEGETNLVFNGQATQVARYMANNVALISFRTDGRFSTQSNIVSVSSDNKWSTASITTPSNVHRFTNDGYLLTNNATPRTYLSTINFSGYGSNDILALPFTIHNASSFASPVTVTITFYHSTGSVVYTQQLTNSGGVYKFGNDQECNEVYQLSLGGKPMPFVFQTRIKTATNYIDLFTKQITSCQVKFATAESLVFAFGSMKITPDSGGYTSRTTVAHRKLQNVLYKTDYEAYVKAEYRLNGI
jgi:hypothetical protein